MRLVSIHTKATFTILFVFAVIPVEILNVRVALESQDVGGYPVEKPAVVANDDSAAREILKGFFQGSHCIYVEIVCGLV
jgi:hypothetical protein